MANQDIEALIKAYNAKSPINEFTQMCESIIQFYYERGYLSYRQIRVLERQVYENEKDEINQIINDTKIEEEEKPPEISVNGEIKNPKAFIKIDFDKVPKNCYECPMRTQDYSDFIGDYAWYCMFGCSIWECAIKRPPDCPIVLVK